MNCTKLTVVSLLGSALFLSAMTSVQAASECKGLEQNICGDSSQCRWIVAYKRSDGRDVRGYCRTMPAVDDKQKVSQAKTS